MTLGWPAVLRDDSVRGSVVLRPFRPRDMDAWLSARARNTKWLQEWEATSPVPLTTPPPTFRQFVRMLNRHARDGVALPFGVVLDDELVGQVTVSGIVHGSSGSGNVGYWVSEHVAGRGVTPTAVALAVDHCFQTVGMHRVEINVRPENAASLRVVEKLGLREEGLRERFLHINGQWRDHRSFAVTSEEVPHGLLTRWQGQRGY